MVCSQALPPFFRNPRSDATGSPSLFLLIFHNSFQNGAGSSISDRFCFHDLICFVLLASPIRCQIHHEDTWDRPSVCTRHRFDPWVRPMSQTYGQNLSCIPGIPGDGPHTIYPVGDTKKPVQVSCEQKLFSGGWVIFQRRAEGGVLNFTKLWDDYRNGFGGQGDDTGELWLGNEHVHQISSGYGTTSCILYITVTANDGIVCSALIQGFKLDNEDMDYTIRFSTIDAIGCGKNDFSTIANQPFRTLDRQGNASFHDCFKSHSAGWWYYNDRDDSCYYMFLNGPHLPEGVQNDDTMFMKGIISS